MLEGQQPTIWGLSIAFSMIAIAAVGLRFYARKIKSQKSGADDWTILVALVRLTTVLGSYGVLKYYHGKGIRLLTQRLLDNLDWRHPKRSHL